ncbi:amidohydrolase [Roseateles sp. BYS180W]|uniref:Amidohydrolase n=1 Tax=Roseateles rivi TaxID=3299028 RepID=A0ABW7FX29_9BURK
MPSFPRRLASRATWTLCFSAALVALCSTAHSHSSAEPAQGALGECKSLTVFTARTIITMNPAHPSAKAVAVCQGRIVGVADTVQELKPWTDKIPTQINTQFANSVLLPGFIDAHQHPFLGAITSNLPPIASLPTAQAYGPDIAGVRSDTEAFERIRRYIAQAPAGDAPVLVWGWDVPTMGRHLTRDELDRVSPNRAVVVWDASQHHAYVNSAFLSVRKVPEDIKTPGVMRDANGRLNGQFLGALAAGEQLIPLLGSKLAPKEATRLMRWLIDLNRRGGITTSTEHSLGLFSVDLEPKLLDSVYNRPDTPQRLIAIPFMPAMLARYGGADKALVAVKELQARSTERLMYRGIKIITDDSFNGLTFKPGGPGYTSGEPGLWITPPDKLADLLLPWWRDGQQLFVHSIGVQAQDVTLAALRQLQQLHPRSDHRFTIEHLGMARSDQVRAMKNLGAVGNANPYYLWLRGEQYTQVLGTDRSHEMAPVGELVRQGVPVTLHSDFPIGPPRPLLAVSLSVTRQPHSAKAAPMAPGLRTTVEQALRMITIDAAYVLGVDDRLGSIEVGKLADFTALAADPLKTQPYAIRDIAVHGTVVGGAVYLSSDIKPPAP